VQSGAAIFNFVIDGISVDPDPALEPAPAFPPRRKTMSNPNHQLVRDFFTAIARGELPDELVTPDLNVWTQTSGDNDRARFAGGVKLLSAAFGGTLNYHIESLTAEEDRVAAEVKGCGTLNGEPYENVQMFLFRIRDGRIASAKEHMNQELVRQRVVPAIQALMARQSA
jgi:ketosteroid isomerase-like protein